MSDFALTLTPTDVTVGSNAQVLYRFMGDMPPFAKAVLTEQDEALQRVNASGLYTIQSARLEKTGGVCSVVLDIIPWKSGKLVIEPIVFSVKTAQGEESLSGKEAGQGASRSNMASTERADSVTNASNREASIINKTEQALKKQESALIAESSAEQADASSLQETLSVGDAVPVTQTFTVTVPPLFIQSVISQNAETQTLAPPAPPVVIPGTTYAVCAVAIAGVLVVFSVLSVVMRIQKIRDAFTAFLGAVLQRRNYRRLVRTAKKLLRKKAPDSVTAATILVHAFKAYLEKRFNHPFTARVAAEVAATLFAMYPAHAKEINAAAQSLSFCDFVRFSAHGGTCGGNAGTRESAGSGTSSGAGKGSGVGAGLSGGDLTSNRVGVLTGKPEKAGARESAGTGVADSMSNRASSEVTSLGTAVAAILSCAALFEKEEADVPN